MRDNGSLGRRAASKGGCRLDSRPHKSGLLDGVGRVWGIVGVLVSCAAVCAGQETFPGSAALDAVVNEAVQSGLIPGAVLIVGHDGKILHRKAYGSRALVPQREAMTVDTIFDLASLTKVIATTSAAMKVFEDGKLRLSEKVTDYLPEFQGGKSDITIRESDDAFFGVQAGFRSRSAVQRV